MDHLAPTLVQDLEEFPSNNLVPSINFRKHGITLFKELSSMSSNLSDFHEGVEKLRHALDTASYSNSGRSSHHYEIRRSIRLLQGVLNREHFALPPPDEAGETKVEAYEQVTQDMIDIAVIEYENKDPSIATMIQSLVSQVLPWLYLAPWLSPVQLQGVLHRILQLFQNDNSLEYVDTIEGMVELLNKHVPNHEDIPRILRGPNDLFVTLHCVITFVAQQQHQESHCQDHVDNSFRKPPLPFVVFIGNLMEYWTFQCLQDHDGNAPCDLNSWLRNQFLRDQDVSSYQIHHRMQHDVDAFVENIELYGTQLTDATLHILETTGKHPCNQLPHDPQHENSGQYPSTVLEEEHVITILQYATLASNFIASTRETSLYPKQTVSAMIRSLWRALVNFIVLHIDNEAVHRDSDLTRNCQIAATETLWRLAQMHDVPVVIQDTPLIVATCLSLWKHADQFWDDDAVNWIRNHLRHLPAGSPSGLELRRSLQAVILSYMYFPSQEYSKGPADSLVEILFPAEEHEASGNGTDPWAQLVLWKLSSQQGDSQLQNSESPNDNLCRDQSSSIDPMTF